MRRTILLPALLCFLVTQILLTGCAVVATCPTQLLPVVEVQVNNTASTHDDYLTTTGYTPCRARISNVNKVFGSGLNFPGGVEVELRNKKLSTDLTVSATSSGSTTSFFATLPGNGSWLDFFIKGNTTSSIDKSAILEIASAGVTCNEVVLTRKGVMVPTGAPPIPATPVRPQVEIEVGSVSNLDDYIAWSPVFCRIKWDNPPGATATLNVTLRNMSGADRLRFSNTSPATGTTATNATINVSLTGDGSWTQFYIAGNNGNPSINDKDAILEAVETSSGNLLAREGLMVRIRKNVNALTTGERDRYLEAVRDVHQTYNFYMLFKNSHSQTPIADVQAHSGSAFLPWHRAFVLHFERLLQSSDPSVAVPYWHFDQSSPGMFNADFLGSNSSGDLVTLNATNPLVTWNIPGELVGIKRKTPYGDSGIPGSVTGTSTGVATETATLGLGADYLSFKGMEQTTHNGAHNNSGNTISWIAGSRATAPQDPIFYSLHANVDRLWAKWQWINSRFDATQTNVYDRQGSFTSPVVAGQRLGQYVDDSLWPWDNVTGGTGLSQRPTTAPLTPFPITLGSIFPGSRPTIKLLVDYRLTNFGYDDFFPY